MTSMNEDVVPGVQHILNLNGFVQTLDVTPTHVPRKFSDQFVILTNGGSSRAYIYDVRNQAWRYVALT